MAKFLTFQQRSRYFFYIAYTLLQDFPMFTKKSVHSCLYYLSPLINYDINNIISFRISDLFPILQYIVMEPREVGQYDVLTNLLIKSKGLLEPTVAGNDHKLNYNKIYDNPKEYEISYVDALANLEEINDLFKKRINDKNKHYNFFLDESDNPSNELPITNELYQQYKSFLEKGQIFCYTLKNTWTKGKDFFFIQKGTVMKIVHIYEDKVYADLSYHDKVGLMKLAELKIILSNPENDSEN